MTREEAIKRLRAFNTNLNEGPIDLVDEFRMTPLAEALEKIRGYAPDEMLNPLIAAIIEHGIEWCDITDDVYSVAAEFITNAIRPGADR